MPYRIGRVVAALLLWATIGHAQGKERGRDLGVPFDGTPGKFNAITDVAGVEVGHATIISGDGALVVGDRVVAAMRRRSQVGDFRSNLHRGGAGEPVCLEPAVERAAVEAARIMGLRVAGVDLLESRRGPRVVEINSSPGLEGLERATRVDVAGAIVSYAAGLAADRPPVAVRAPEGAVAP